MAITRNQIVEAILEGTAVANTRYEIWSNGWWVTDSGVEGLMGASIAEALHERQEPQECILMELSMADVTRRSKARPKRGPRPTTIRGGNRVDIVLLNRSDRPICVIELKRSWNRDTCLTDLDRVHNLVWRLSYQNGGSLRRGFLAMTIAKSARGRKMPEDRIAEQKNVIETIIRKHFSKRKTTGVRFCLGDSVPLAEPFREDYGNWAAAGFCVEIYVRRAQR